MCSVNLGLVGPAGNQSPNQAEHELGRNWSGSHETPHPHLETLVPPRYDHEGASVVAAKVMAKKVQVPASNGYRTFLACVQTNLRLSTDFSTSGTS